VNKVNYNQDSGLNAFAGRYMSVCHAYSAGTSLSVTSEMLASCAVSTIEGS